MTNHYKKGRCIGCPDFLDRFNSDSSGKILFGNRTKRGDIPWHVTIHSSYENGFHGCGGTLISPSKILSAAHCFGERPKYKFKAIVGNTKVDFQIDVSAGYLTKFAQRASKRYHHLNILLSVTYEL